MDTRLSCAPPPLRTTRVTARVPLALPRRSAWLCSTIVKSIKFSEKFPRRTSAEGWLRHPAASMPRSRLSTLFSLFVSAGGIRLPFNGPGRGGGNVGKMVAVSIGTEQSKQGFVTTYNRLLAEFPYQTKAVGTGITYVFSDSTAQILEQQADTTPTERVTRSLKFGAVGAFWVGPLLAAWFQIMEKVVPGRTLRPVVTKLLADQLLQGPFMISTMFFWTSLSNGATLAEAREKIQQLLYRTSFAPSNRAVGACSARALLPPTASR